MKHRYGIWKPKENSRPTLIVTDDGGKTYTKVAVFSNDESVNIFEQWLLNALAPTVEAEPIRHGHWIEEKSGDIKCSCCGHWSFDMYDEVEIVDGKKIIITTMPHYCGYCGAKMDGDDT